MFYDDALLQLFQNLVCAHTARQQLLEHILSFGLLCSFRNLCVGISLFLFELYNLFFEFFQLCFFCFSFSIQRGNIRAECCDFFSERFCGSIFLSDLCCVINAIKNLCFILASFWSSLNKIPPYIFDTRL